MKERPETLLLERIRFSFTQLLADTGVSALFFTGDSSSVPARLPNARSVEGNTFGSVVIEAKKRYG